MRTTSHNTRCSDVESKKSGRVYISRKFTDGSHSGGVGFSFFMRSAYCTNNIFEGFLYFLCILISAKRKRVAT